MSCAHSLVNGMYVLSWLAVTYSLESSLLPTPGTRRTRAMTTGGRVTCGSAWKESVGGRRKPPASSPSPSTFISIPSLAVVYAAAVPVYSYTLAASAITRRRCTYPNVLF
ncbi:hypothetical protein B0H16DRAFT_1597584 [Mycena metata]|uniref:Uncharacterized protein n=1 Tax=Mycena metata TaxID=1033252 RepID=A0AAD7MM46_9AGAR|nr:hypothetical protein B0H16DRAFT_1597584 [Mycena metata]